MVRQARGESRSAADFLPPSPRPTLPQLRAAAAACRGCDLYKNATQTVFGAGPDRADVMLVGEQPGSAEDLAGEPFVGPAGGFLDRAMAEAGIDRGKAYITNAVKHFKNVPRGKRRIHARPSATEVAACRPWLEAEIAAVRPRVIVCLGATAAQSLLGRDFRVTRERGRLITADPWPAPVLATVHPSAILRMPDAQTRHRALLDLVADLRIAAGAV